MSKLMEWLGRVSIGYLFGAILGLLLSILFADVCVYEKQVDLGADMEVLKSEYQLVGEGQHTYRFKNIKYENTPKE